ncbi:MAG TPA: hypothetical protein VGE45_00550 [Chloroflexia bacterium]|jgi:hypothetical protein
MPQNTASGAQRWFAQLSPQQKIMLRALYDAALRRGTIITQEAPKSRQLEAVRR